MQSINQSNNQTIKQSNNQTNKQTNKQKLKFLTKTTIYTKISLFSSQPAPKILKVFLSIHQLLYWVPAFRRLSSNHVTNNHVQSLRE